MRTIVLVSLVLAGVSLTSTGADAGAWCADGGQGAATEHPHQFIIAPPGGQRPDLRLVHHHLVDRPGIIVQPAGQAEVHHHLARRVAQRRQQIEDGTLTVRKMTAKERAANPPRPRPKYGRGSKRRYG